jgi:hypothetical protein
MAISEDVRIKVRMFYETHSLSAGKVEEHFHSIGYEEVKKKTIEYWMQSDKKAGIAWVKNRYASQDEAFEGLVDIGLMGQVEGKGKEILKAQMLKEHGGALEAEVIEDMAEQGAKEMAYRALNKRSLGVKLAENLNRAEEIVKKTPSMGNVATYHGMLISTHQTVHGKTTNIGLQNPDSKSMSDDDIKKLSTEQLKEMMEEEG